MATIRDRYVLDIDTKGATQNLTRLKGALIAVGGAVVTKQILDITATFEDLRTSLNTVTGSAAAGGAALDKIKDFARTSQFGVEELSKSFIQLKAAGIEPTERLLRTFTDTAAVTTDQLGSLEAITALLSRTTGGGLGLEELERLADRGIPVYRILQEEIGITRQEISEFGQTAEGARTLVEGLLAGLDREFGGATQARLENLSTVMSNFQIALKQVIAEFGEGLAPAVKAIVGDLTNFLDSSEGFAGALGRGIGDLLLSVRNAIAEIADELKIFEAGGLQRAFGELFVGLGEFIEAFQQGVRTLLQGLNAVVSQVARMLNLSDDIEILGKDESVQSRIQELKIAQGYLEDLKAGSPVRGFFEDLLDPGDFLASLGIVNNTLDAQLADVNRQLENLEAGRYINETVKDLDNGTQSAFELSEGIKQLGRDLIAAGEAAELNAAFPQYEDAILRIAAAQERAAQTSGAFLGEPSEVNAIQTQFKSLTDTIADYNQRFLDGLDSQERARIGYAEVRETIAQLNNQLQNNTELTDEQRQQIENAIVVLEREKNALHNVAKSGEFLNDIIQGSKDALRENRAEHEQLVNAIQQLEVQQRSETLASEEGRVALLALQEALAANSAEYDSLTGKVELQNSAISSSVDFYNNLIESARESVREQINAAEAQGRLNEDLAQGKINIDQYAEAKQRLNSILGIVNERTQTYAEYVQEITDRVNDSVRVDEYKARLLEELQEKYGAVANASGIYAQFLDALGVKTDEVADKSKNLVNAIDSVVRASESRAAAALDQEQLIGLEGINRTLKDIELQELRTAEAAKKRIRAQFEGASGVDMSRLNSELARIDAVTQATIESRQRVAQLQEEERLRTEEYQRSFEYGWKNAFDSYKDNATNSAKQAEQIFGRFTKGMEDAIVGFARTGKFSMRDFLADIAEMILRSQIQRLMAQMFGGFNLFGGGGGSSRFAGGFANGGTIPAGQFGLVGENGPEFITGPANITPMGGGSNITLNINAVDAPSFQQLIARDPKFVFAVAEQGRRSIPEMRR